MSGLYMTPICTVFSCLFSYLRNYQPESDVCRLSYTYRKIAPLRGLYSEGPIYGGKFVLQNRLGLYLEGNLCLKIDWTSLLGSQYSWKEI